MADESADGDKWVRACVHAQRFIIDGNEAGKWLRNAVEMKEGMGVVILKQEKWACFLPALHWGPVAEEMDKHLSRQALPQWQQAQNTKPSRTLTR